MLVIRIEEWPGGDADHRRPIARIDVANRTGLAPVSDYEVVLRPTAGEPGGPAVVYGHRRDDGWLPLVRAALRAVDPNGGFYTSPTAQVPADVLALLPLNPYVSRACQTARAIAACTHIELATRLTAHGLPEQEDWAEEFRKMCRRTEKYTGLECQDPWHRGEDPDDSTTWTVTTTVTGPTPGDAEHWAGTLRDLQLAEHGQHMRLDITVAPVAPETPHDALLRRQLERGVAMWNAGADEPASTVEAATGERAGVARAAADEECECGHYFTSHLSAGRMGAKCHLCAVLRVGDPHHAFKAVRGPATSWIVNHCFEGTPSGACTAVLAGTICGEPDARHALVGDDHSDDVPLADWERELLAEAVPVASTPPCGRCGRLLPEGWSFVQLCDTCLTAANRESAELHSRCAHPGWEYVTADAEHPLPAGGDQWRVNQDVGLHGSEFPDHTGKSYWRRPKRTDGDPQ